MLKNNGTPKIVSKTTLFETNENRYLKTEDLNETQNACITRLTEKRRKQAANKEFWHEFREIRDELREIRKLIQQTR